jgi:coatomer subunit beta'
MTPILVQQVIEDDGVEENQEDAVEVEAEGSTDGVLVNGNSSEEQWGMKNEEPSA